MGINKYKEILKKYSYIDNLNCCIALLDWDQAVNIPKKGISARADMVETLTKISHNANIEDKFYDLINDFINSSEFNELRESINNK